MMPSCSHTGTPPHFHASTTSGSASLIRARRRPSIVPRQSPSAAIFASISCEGDSLVVDGRFVAARFGDGRLVVERVVDLGLDALFGALRDLLFVIVVDERFFD